ncbi:hypothetical protein WJX72_007867 [[Myrmecia] bisecta]|uniref:Nodulin-like domain-containing protein n=1 Tax=[Myrmecia] bisecta TaxID=41462 RepID=A0AAW1Q862_9CHLO
MAVLVFSVRHKAGPRITLMIGLVLHLGGYTALYCAASGMFRPPYWVVVAIAVVAFNGGSWVDTTCIATSVRNFPHDRGTAVGILKSFVGISAATYTTLYVAAFRPHAIRFLLFIGIAPVVIGIVAIPFMNHVPFRQRSELELHETSCTTGMRFGIAYQVVLTMGLAQMAAAIFGAHRLDHHMRVVMLVGSIVLLLPLLAIPYRSGGLRARPARRTSEDEAFDLIPAKEVCRIRLALAATFGRPAGASGVDEPLLMSDAGLEAQPLVADRARTPGDAFPVDLTPWQCQSSINYWLLFLVFGIDTSMGMLFLNNLGQIVQSRGGSHDGQALLVSLFSVLNATGRLAFGYIPERTLHLWGVPRSFFLVVVAAASTMVAAWAAVASVQALSAVAFVWGFAYGGHWSLMPALASEVFGLTHFATNYCLLQMATSIGSYTLATKLAGYLYQQSVTRHGDSDNICLGQDCFRLTFLIAAGLGLLSTLLATILLYRTRGLYRREFDAIVADEEELEAASREDSLINAVHCGGRFGQRTDASRL